MLVLTALWKGSGSILVFGNVPVDFDFDFADGKRFKCQPISDNGLVPAEQWSVGHVEAFR